MPAFLIGLWAANIATKVVGSSPTRVGFSMEKISNLPKHNGCIYDWVPLLLSQ